MSWFVYILRCEHDKLYTGVTTDVERRFNEHCQGKTGAKYTKANKPIEIAYTKKHKDRSSAQIDEARIKKLSKQEKEELIGE